MSTSEKLESYKLAYARFNPLVEQCKKYLGAETKERQSLGIELLASGDRSHVFKVNEGGQSYALKIINDEGNSVSNDIGDTVGHKDASEIEVGALLNVVGIDNVYQLVAFSYEDGVIVSTLMPGVAVGKLTEGEGSKIDREMLLDLVKTFAKLYDRGVMPDTDYHNLITDFENKRISVIDVWPLATLQNYIKSVSRYIQAVNYQGGLSDSEATRLAQQFFTEGCVGTKLLADLKNAGLV